MEHDTVRVVGMNIAGLPIGPSGAKYDSLREFMTVYQISVLCLQELNNAWHKQPVEMRLRERTQGWFPAITTRSAWFSLYPSVTASVVGGTAIILQGDVVGRVKQSGIDPHGLGRWTWVKLRGFEGKSMLVVSAYRPFYNPGGECSVWSQHKTFFDSKHPPRLVDPRDAFIMDLVADLRPHYRSGSQIVMAMDTNEKEFHLANNVIEVAFREFGMEDICFFKHGRQNAPATTNTGSKPIDTVMVTRSL